MYGNEDRNGATRNKERNCDFKKDYVTTEELQR
jgi:hypothetical protein